MMPSTKAIWKPCVPRLTIRRLCFANRLLRVGNTGSGSSKGLFAEGSVEPGQSISECSLYDGNRSYPAAIRDLQAEGRLNSRCRRRAERYANNRIESDHRQVKQRLRAMQGPRTLLTARRLIQGIEAVQMLKKGEILGAIRTNLVAVSIAFALLFGIA